MNEKISPVANNVDGANVSHCCKLNHCLTYSTVGTILYDGITCTRKRTEATGKQRCKAQGIREVGMQADVATLLWWQ